MYRKGDDDKYNKPGSANRWALLKNVLSFVGVVALIYVPVSMLLLPTPTPATALVDATLTTLSPPSTLAVTPAPTPAAAPPSNVALPEHHPADVRRIAEMQATIVTAKKKKKKKKDTSLTHLATGSIDGGCPTTERRSGTGAACRTQIFFFFFFFPLLTSSRDRRWLCTPSRCGAQPKRQTSCARATTI
jgi:hypothetical protein